MEPGLLGALAQATTRKRGREFLGCWAAPSQADDHHASANGPDPKCYVPSTGPGAGVLGGTAQSSSRGRPRLARGWASLAVCQSRTLDSDLVLLSWLSAPRRQPARYGFQLTVRSMAERRKTLLSTCPAGRTSPAVLALSKTSRVQPPASEKRGRRWQRPVHVSRRATARVSEALVRSQIRSQNISPLEGPTPEAAETQAETSAQRGADPRQHLASPGLPITLQQIRNIHIWSQIRGNLTSKQRTSDQVWFRPRAWSACAAG